MDEFKVGDVVLAKLGKADRIGTVIYLDVKRARYLVRFGASQQLYYTADQLRKYEG